MMTGTVRIDKWLWAARFFKTRSLATDAVDTGKVKLGGERIKPARPLRIGDELHIDNGSAKACSICGFSTNSAIVRLPITCPM